MNDNPVHYDPSLESPDPFLSNGKLPSDDLPWAVWPWGRCRAYREPGHPDGWFGRCELRRHKPDVAHALDRGMEQVRWFTHWTAATRPDDDPGLLTADEHQVVEDLGAVAGQIRSLCGDGPVATGDWKELAAAIHVLQFRVLAQAAARAYPDRYRLLGRRGAWTE